MARFDKHTHAQTRSPTDKRAVGIEVFYGSRGRLVSKSYPCIAGSAFAGCGLGGSPPKRSRSARGFSRGKGRRTTKNQHGAGPLGVGPRTNHSRFPGKPGTHFLQSPGQENPREKKTKNTETCKLAEPTSSNRGQRVASKSNVK